MCPDASVEIRKYLVYLNFFNTAPKTRVPSNLCCLFIKTALLSKKFKMFVKFRN